jgi:nucleotidyltransferase substrate binding protein (TIGR01987 family)
MQPFPQSTPLHKAFTMTEDIRWQQRFDNLQRAFALLQDAVQENARTPGSKLVQMALIKAFEMTFELSWKTMKDYLTHNGMDVKLPREIIKQAFATALVSDGQVWIDMLQDRNLMAHTYDDARAALAVEHICTRYVAAMAQLQQHFLASLR